jgi:tRNA threonylcarbamoyladenosine biosynthesis protein TsaB
MITLAMEQSTATASLALFRDTTLIAERSWTDAPLHSQGMFTVLPELLAAGSVAVPDIERFAVGLGPGSFAGLRIALSAFRAMALPDHRPVYGVSSGEALAHGLGSEIPCPIFAVGDARRNRLWLGQFAREACGSLVLAAPYELMPVESLAARLPAGSTTVTSDWARIGAVLQAHCPAGVKVIQRAVVPTARSVGEIALQRIARDIPSDPLSPIYLHPPVFVAPRYPS